MKIRTGFVTNSSSSSFILVFDNQNDVEQFEENCNFLNYSEFYNLINNLCGDFLIFTNETREKMPIRPLIDKIKNNDWGIHGYYELQKLYNEDYKLKPWETISVQLNKFHDNAVNLDELDFVEISEEDQYSIEVVRHIQDKEAAIEDLRWQYASDYIWDLLNEKFKRENYEDFDSFYAARNEYKKTDEYKDLIDKYLAESDFNEKKNRIEKSYLMISGTIYDTDGGLLEWSIRNGFIEDNFHSNCIICYNVG